MRTSIGGITAIALAAVPAVMSALPGEARQQPQFRASTEIISIDTHVVARDGAPIDGLTADQFDVEVDGRRRPVVSAEFLRATGPAAAVPAGAVTPEGLPVRDGRVIVLAIDQASFPASAHTAAREAVTRVVDRVAVEDYLGMVAFPGRLEVAPTRDRSRMRGAIPRISGHRMDITATRFTLSASEASLLKSRDSLATRDITARECRMSFDPLCPQAVVVEGGMIADALEQQAMLSIAGLRAVLDAMASVPGRKTLMVLSAGLPMSAQPGGRPNLAIETDSIARRAAAANVSLYVLYMNIHFLRSFSAESGKRNHTIFDDIALFGHGLERFASSGGGSFFQVEVNSDPFVGRSLRETSASYLLAVQAAPEERDGKEHFIRVSVKQKGAAVRYRRIVTIPRSGQ
jgi:VWFA-related protein